MVDVMLPRRISFFLADLPLGGVETVCLTLARGLTARDYEVDLVVADAGGLDRRRLPNPVQVIDLRRRRAVTAIVPLAQYLRARQPAVLVAAKDHANIVAIAAAKFSRAPVRVVATEHGRPSDALASPERWTGHVVRSLVTWVYPHADSVVAVSDGVADDLRRLIAPRTARVEVIRNPVVGADLAATACSPPPHPWFARGHSEPVVVWCGRLAEEKDPLTAVDAFATLRRQRRARLVVVGDGPLRDAVSARACRLGVGDEVLLTGFLDDPRPYLAHADALLLTSRREGLPTVLIEALALGTPVVSTDCPTGPSELLDHGRLGRLVPVGEPDGIAAALDDVLTTPPPRADEEHLAPYRVEVAVDHYLELFESLQ